MSEQIIDALSAAWELPLYILLIFLALVLHEMGHYWAARLFKMPIDTVVIGRGKTFKFWDDKIGARWSLRRWPLGAYVHLRGVESADQTGAFAAAPFWQRLLTILAGPLANFAVLPFLFFAFYMSVGLPSTPAVVTGVEQGLAAERAGLQPGDRFVAVDGIPLSNGQDIWRYAYSKKDTEGLYTIKRGDEVFDVSIKPDWAEYLDSRGVERANARFGIVWQHSPFKLEAVMSVNGANTEDNEDNEDLARDALINIFDQPAIIGLKGPDGEAGLTKVQISSAINDGLFDEDHKNFEHIYLGHTRGNIYLTKTLKENMLNALRYSAKMIGSVAGVPFQLLPIDKSKIKDGNAVSNPDSLIVNKIYALMHLFALASVAIGLINFMPLPGLDGGHILVLVLEKVTQRQSSRKVKAIMFAAIFFLFYMSVLLANLDNLPHYIDSRLENVHEFIDKHTSKEE